MGRSVLSATGIPYCCFVQARAQEIERLQQDHEKQENGRAYQSMLHRRAAQLYEGDDGEREETCSREDCTIKHQMWERCGMAIGGHADKNSCGPSCITSRSCCDPAC